MPTKPSTKKAEFTPKDVWNITEKLQELERIRAGNRALIDNIFNGGVPYSAAEVEKYQIHINVNWLEGQRILITAINQLNNALIFKERLFTATPKKCKPEKKQDYSDIFTRNIHEPLKNGLTGNRMMFLLKSRNAQVALHGIGPILWPNGFRWRGRNVALEDLLIPTDTLCDLSNLMFFAVNLYLTVGEFFDMVSSEKVDKGWDMKSVNKIINDVIKPDQMQQDQWSTVRDQPEKNLEWLKQNRWAWNYDAATTIKLRTFYYKDHAKKKWYRCIILREGTPNFPAKDQTEFLYDGTDTPFADSINHILHIQYGDNSIVGPLKHQSVRGMGVSMYSAIECNNRLRCEFVQHVFFNLKTLLRINNPSDRDRPKVLDMSQYSVIEDGITFIKQEERYQIDQRLVDTAMSQMRQLMSESSSSYVQNINDGTNKEMTATEASARLQSVNQQVSAMLQSMFAQEEFLYQEEVRRFCDKNSEDPEVKEFQERCIADGIPGELMDAGNWSVKVERVLGGGDQFLAAQEADKLLSQTQRFDPNSQRIILRNWVTTTTRDPKMAETLVPKDPHQATPGTIAAEDVFATLMLGVPVSIREGIDRGPYIEALLGMVASVVQQIQSGDNVGSAEQITGLKTVLQHVSENIEIIAQDMDQKQRVKGYMDAVGQLSNETKGFEQRYLQQQEEEQKNAQMDPAIQAKIQSDLAAAQQKIAIAEASSQQKMQQSQAAFQLKLKQDMEAHNLEMQRLIQESSLRVASETATASTKIANENKKTNADISNQEKKTQSDISSAKKKAAATKATAADKP